MMLQERTEDLIGYPGAGEARAKKRGISSFFSREPLTVSRPSLIHFSSTPLFRLEQHPEKYAHLLRKKDVRHIGPIVNYFINGSGHVAFLGGDLVNNLYLRGKRSYKTINILAIVTDDDVGRYAGVMNNIISSNDGAFSMGCRYRVRKNRHQSCFGDIAVERYVIDSRLEGPAKLLYPFRPSAIELDLTTQKRFSSAFGVEIR